MKKILIIEDDKTCREELSALLKSALYEPVIMENFTDPLKYILDITPDLILLDINIPNTNGEILLDKLRKTSDIPVIMVTSKNTEVDEVLSMSYGADDFVTKPYNPNILLLRIQAVLKRVSSYFMPSYKNLDIDLKKGTLKNGDTEIILTKNEMIIFSHLLNNQNRIVTRDELMTDLWDNDEYINDNALTVNISRLRNKLKDLGLENAIETRKGMGYILS